MLVRACVRACVRVSVDYADYVERVDWVRECLIHTVMFTWGSANLIKCCLFEATVYVVAQGYCDVVY